MGLELFSIKSSAKNLTAAESQSWCFVAGTLVATEAGYKAIEEIEAGDTVLAENPETGEVAYKTVLETYENETNELVHVHVNGETISATPSHPFYVNQFGWTRAADLRAGDVLVLSNGEYVVVELIQHEILESPVKVYNFEVKDFHTYFVGESGALVHNGCGDDVSQTWNEFQAANKGKYTKQEMSDAWLQYKKDHYPNGGEHYLHRPYLTKETMDAINANTTYNSKGQLWDPISEKWLDPGTPLDLGHVREHEFWFERDMAEKMGMSQADFNKYMNNPDFYAWQGMHENRSCAYEATH